MTVGQVIRQKREERGWSQAKLGVLSGNGPSGISQIETGRRNPSAATLQRIAEALKVEVRDLFPLEQAPLPDIEDERREDRRAAARDAIVYARRFVLLYENVNTIRDRMDEYREAWEARLANEDLDKTAIEEAGRAISTFWPAVATVAEAEAAELKRIGTPPEEIEERSVLLGAMARFQALGDRVNEVYRKMPQDTAEATVYQFPQREAS